MSCVWCFGQKKCHLKLFNFITNQLSTMQTTHASVLAYFLYGPVADFDQLQCQTAACTQHLKLTRCDVESAFHTRESAHQNDIITVAKLRWLAKLQLTVARPYSRQARLHLAVFARDHAFQCCSFRLVTCDGADRNGCSMSMVCVSARSLVSLALKYAG